MSKVEAKKLTWFGIAGYPEIKSVQWDVTADLRPGKFIGLAVCAEVRIGEFRGTVCFFPGDPRSEDVLSTIESAKQCVDYHRAKIAEGKAS